MVHIQRLWRLFETRHWPQFRALTLKLRSSELALCLQHQTKPGADVWPIPLHGWLQILAQCMQCNVRNGWITEINRGLPVVSNKTHILRYIKMTAQSHPQLTLANYRDALSRAPPPIWPKNKTPPRKIANKRETNICVGWGDLITHEDILRDSSLDVLRFKER